MTLRSVSTQGRARRPAPRKARSSLGAYLAVVFSAALLAACDRNETAEREGDRPAASEPLIQLREPGPRRVHGNVFDDDDFRLEVGTPRICNETAPFLPEPGLMRISIPVEVRAKTRRLIPISPLSFQLVDRQGHEYGPTLAGCHPALKNVRLGEGQSVAGDVAFDVTVGARDLELGFDPFLIGRTEVHAFVRVPKAPGRGEANAAPELHPQTPPAAKAQPAESPGAPR